jgi:hypothetical protein
MHSKEKFRNQTQQDDQHWAPTVAMEERAEQAKGGLIHHYNDDDDDI